jgi:methylmalonyl-CoA mutase, N-terminal domain
MVRDAASSDENLMPVLIDAVSCYCTVGEIVTALKDVWGEFQEPKII